MPPVLKPRRADVVRDIQSLLRTFTPVHAVIYRADKRFTPVLTEGAPAATVIYQGEVLVAPASGELMRFGLGTYEATKPLIVLTGTWPVRQGDRVDLTEPARAGQEPVTSVFEVEFAPNWWHAYLVLRLKQLEQR